MIELAERLEQVRRAPTDNLELPVAADASRLGHRDLGDRQALLGAPDREKRLDADGGERELLGRIALLPVQREAAEEGGLVGAEDPHGVGVMAAVQAIDQPREDLVAKPGQQVVVLAPGVAPISRSESAGA